jgi:hypothetical protein
VLNKKYYESEKLQEAGFDFLTAVVMKCCCLPECNAMQSIGSQPIFQRNTSPLSSVLKKKPCKKPA